MGCHAGPSATIPFYLTRIPPPAEGCEGGLPDILHACPWIGAPEYLVALSGTAGGLSPWSAFSTIRWMVVPLRLWLLGFRAYQRLLAARSTSEPRLRDRAIEELVRVAALGLQVTSGICFPPQTRDQGGWYWTWRWRFEFLTGWLDMESTTALRDFVKLGSTVLDVGAHVGYYTLLLSRLVGPQGRVVAFEPDPLNLDLLRKNLSARKAWNVAALQTAVSDRTGAATLYRAAGSGNHSLLPYTKAIEEISVGCTTIDDYAEENRIGPVAFVKVDVEGAEPLVLRGMRRTLERSPSLAMLIEYNPRALRSGGTEPHDYLREIERLGFKLWRLTVGERPSRVRPSVDLDICPVAAINLLCTKG